MMSEKSIARGDKPMAGLLFLQGFRRSTAQRSHDGNRAAFPEGKVALSWACSESERAASDDASSHDYAPDRGCFSLRGTRHHFLANATRRRVPKTPPREAPLPCATAVVTNQPRKNQSPHALSMMSEKSIARGDKPMAGLLFLQGFRRSTAQRSHDGNRAAFPEGKVAPPCDRTEAGSRKDHSPHPATHCGHPELRKGGPSCYFARL